MEYFPTLKKGKALSCNFPYYKTPEYLSEVGQPDINLNTVTGH